MKLHEFTDRLYAMGGIEQEEKKNRRLNEDINSDERLNLNESKQGLVDYFYDLASKTMDASEQVYYLLSYINESDLLEAIDDLKDYMDIED